MSRVITIELNDDGKYSVESTFKSAEETVFWLEWAKHKVFEDTFRSSDS